jgi:hypothetical protein
MTEKRVLGLFAKAFALHSNSNLSTHLLSGEKKKDFAPHKLEVGFFQEWLHNSGNRIRAASGKGRRWQSSRGT